MAPSSPSDGASIKPRAIHLSFSFYANPANTCSTNNEHFNLVMEARQWFASAGIYWPLTEGCYDGAFQSEAPPIPGLLTGDNPVTNTTKIRFVNTGNLAWYNDGNFRLASPTGCSMFYDSTTWINCYRASSHVVNASNPNKTWVDPGEVGEFDVVLNAPATAAPGSYSAQWQLLDEGAQVLASSRHTSTYTILT